MFNITDYLSYKNLLIFLLCIRLDFSDYVYWILIRHNIGLKA